MNLKICPYYNQKCIHAETSLDILSKQPLIDVDGCTHKELQLFYILGANPKCMKSCMGRSHDTIQKVGLKLEAL